MSQEVLNSFSSFLFENKFVEIKTLLSKENKFCRKKYTFVEKTKVTSTAYFLPVEMRGYHTPKGFEWADLCDCGNMREESCQWQIIT
jgi:hypothetical protein